LNHIINIINLQQSLIITHQQSNHSYHPYNFNINHYLFKTTLPKKTTNKKPYFLSLSQKHKTNKNPPFHYHSFPPKLILHLIDHYQLAHFIFPKHLLFHKPILTHHQSKPKIAFPLYPTCHKDLSP
ncbi:MepB family protein, partial [Staphylococcus epidermidis]|uniref:MepB family protein n=1 Tax=Staphylococcus epidermidis TaxID=1282 RepID=UPI0021B485DE